MRLVRALLAARAERAERIRAAFLDAFDPFGHPGFAMALEEVAGIVARALEEPCSRRLEREVEAQAKAAGARPTLVWRTRILAGVRRRGQTAAEAVEAGRRVRAEARDPRFRPGRGREGRDG